MTTRNPVLIAALLALSVLAGAYAKSYDLTLTTPVAVGTVQLPAGNYRLAFKDATATLTDTASGKDYSLPVKVTNAAKKFKETVIDSDETVHPRRLRAVGLGGSTTRLEFGQ